MADPVYLRALELKDLERTHKWHNSAALYKALGGTFLYVSQDAERQWLEQHCRFSHRELNLAICVTESDEHIGNLYLRDIDWVARTAELHIFIGDPDKQSGGYGTSALGQLFRYAFDTLNLRRIHLKVLGDNDQAIRVYKKLGFVVEGRLKDHVFKDGQYKDMILMALMKERVEEDSEP